MPLEDEIIEKTVEWARGTEPKAPEPEPVLNFKELPRSETYPKETRP